MEFEEHAPAPADPAAGRHPDAPPSAESRRRSREPRRASSSPSRRPGDRDRRPKPDAAPAATGEERPAASEYRPAGAPPRRGEREQRTDERRPRRQTPAEGATKPDPAAGNAAPPAKSADAKPAPAPVPAATATPATFLEELGGTLLADVSRSFYLSIKLLPEPLRAPISLGYLLARALDSVADTAPLPAAARLERLRELAEMIKLGAEPEQLRPFQRELAPKQEHPGERALLSKLDRCLAWLDALDPADRWELRRTLARIAHGQELDLRRFGAGTAAEPKALERAKELQDYAYFVAGSAGEFWTRLCERHLPDYRKLPAGEMLTLGRRLGQGLQLVNILRDLRADLAAGRCYLPKDDLDAAGLAPADLLRTPERARPLLAKWRAAAVEHLDAGWQYVAALKPAKLRYACTLPVLLGIRTLALLAETSPLENAQPVKVPRLELRKLMLSAGVGLVAARWIDGTYQRARRRAVSK